jgi:4-diphosphocytidyl-2-C-methyl-D-erythritol kinase
MTGILVDRAPAKINLTLRVLGVRADRYHELDSLVTFADVADRLSFKPGGGVELKVGGPNAKVCGPDDDNLILKAARALAERVEGLTLGRFALVKRLPVAAGIGGGSSDAAAALRLLARVQDLALDDPRLLSAARATGADVPVCLDPRTRVMRGIGEVLSAPLDLPALDAVLVNPGVPVATRDIFAALGRARGYDASRPVTAAVAGDEVPAIPTEREALYAYLAATPNDLEPPAVALCPVIGTVLEALRALPDVRLVRMTGSGATCFALFDSAGAATRGRARLARARPTWWVRATVLGG